MSTCLVPGPPWLALTLLAALQNFIGLLQCDACRGDHQVFPLRHDLGQWEVRTGSSQVRPPHNLSPTREEGLWIQGSHGRSDRQNGLQDNELSTIRTETRTGRRLSGWKHDKMAEAASPWGAATVLTSSRKRSCSSSLRKSMSREDMMPTKRLPMRPVSVMGIPQKPCRALASNTSRTRSLGLRTTGSVMNPCSYFWKGQQERLSCL